MENLEKKRKILKISKNGQIQKSIIWLSSSSC